MLSFLHSPTLISIHAKWKTIDLTRRAFVGKVTSLLFSMLSRLVITFLPRSERLLVSRSAVMLPIRYAVMILDLSHSAWQPLAMCACWSLEVCPVWLRNWSLILLGFNLHVNCHMWLVSGTGNCLNVRNDKAFKEMTILLNILQS